MAAADQLSYFDGTPEGFRTSVDLVFCLNSGEELPVHSAFLCAQSQIFCDMLVND